MTENQTTNWTVRARILLTAIICLLMVAMGGDTLGVAGAVLGLIAYVFGFANGMMVGASE